MPLLLAALLLADPQSASTAAPFDYADVKPLATADEASVTGAAHTAMLTAQKTLLDAGVEACALGKPQTDFAAFTIVMRLDADGRVQQTWRQGSSPLAICLQRYVREKIVFVPPKAPFYSALEISFTK